MGFPHAYFDETRRDQTRIEREWQTISDFLCALPRRVTVVVLTESGFARRLRFRLEQMKLNCRLEVADNVPSHGLDGRNSLWIRDSFLAAKDLTGPVCVRAWTNGGLKHGEWIAAWKCIRTIEPQITIEGGNCLVGPDFWLVGACSVRMTAEHFRLPNIAAGRTALSSLDHRQMYVAGYSSSDAEGGGIGNGDAIYQADPVGHIDLVLSITGIKRNGRPVLLLADPIGSGESSRLATLRRRLAIVAERLEEHGFQVIRNPVPFLPLPGSAGRLALRPYNNVLLENTPKPTVWLPTFSDQEKHLAAIDDSNAQIWARLGFEVIPLPGWTAFADKDGGPRCMANVIERGPAA